MRKTKEDAERTRKAILDAAETVFFERGVAGASLAEIARVAGVTRGAVYWHFPNKLHVFLAIGDRVRLPHEEALDRLETHPTDDPITALEECITAKFSFYGRDARARMRMTVLLLRCDYVGEMAPALGRHALLMQGMTTRFTQFFCDVVPCPALAGPLCTEAGGWQPVMVAKTFAALLHGTLMLSLRQPDDYPLDTVGVAIVREFIAALRGRWRESPALHAGQVEET